ncbi:MAG: hypothetical protein F6K18_29230 [Okeania sp. SIO2C2]|uniref:hypothetical protein n=1 Tax=Okeania sp. SIO2C2 TaxID=2607787 RepID=UPI0013B6304C|nr:hypothetical protein [Okeania sp. SIO2C2]NEP90571.1 hypothetical protein [Okeania sp. SIO2C2]
MGQSGGSSDQNSVPENGEQSGGSSDQNSVPENREQTGGSSDQNSVPENREQTGGSSDQNSVPENREQTGSSSDRNSDPENREILEKIKNIIKNIKRIVIPISLLVGTMSMVVTIVEFSNLFEKDDEAKYQGWYAFQIVGNAVVREFENRKAPLWETLPRFNFNFAPHSNQTTLFYTDFPINRED